MSTVTLTPDEIARIKTRCEEVSFAQAMNDGGRYKIDVAGEYMRVVTPAAVLALIAQIETLEKSEEEAWARRRQYFHERGDWEKKRITELQAALTRYGRHDTEDPNDYECRSYIDGPETCDCGFDEARGGR